jgi:hypothetical protein
MSKNIIFVLMYGRHKFLDVIGMEGLFKLECDDACSDIFQGSAPALACCKRREPREISIKRPRFQAVISE